MSSSLFCLQTCFFDTQWSLTWYEGSDKEVDMNNFSPEHFESIAKINLTSNIGVYFVLFGIVIQIFQFKTILLSSSPLSVKCYDIAYGFCCAIPNFYIFPTPYYCDVACVETLCVQFSARTASHAQATWSLPTRRGLIMITLHREPYLAIFSHCNSLIPIAYKSKDVKGPL